MTDKVPHEWITSRLGHGETQCIHCFATNREIAVIGDLNHCPDHAAKKRKVEEDQSHD